VRRDSGAVLAAERDAMLSHDETHWWYRGRRRIVLGFAQRLGLPPDSSVLDAGCGSGCTMRDLAQLGTVWGVDSDPIAVRCAQEKAGPRVRLASVERLPWRTPTFDLVTCLDVIEHLDDDVGVLRELLRVTVPGGALLVTVPAFQRLWSRHDEVNGHRRRYVAGSLRMALVEAGWRVVDDTYFNSVLLPAAALARVATRRLPSRGRSDLQMTPARLDGVLEAPLRFEASLLARGMRLPAGLSLLCVCRRPIPTLAAGGAGPGRERPEARPRTALPGPNGRGRVALPSAPRARVQAPAPDRTRLPRGRPGGTARR
jgi:SAM-dependent methyltransferase